MQIFAELSCLGFAVAKYVKERGFDTYGYDINTNSMEIAKTGNRFWYAFSEMLPAWAIMTRNIKWPPDQPEFSGGLFIVMRRKRICPHLRPTSNSTILSCYTVLITVVKRKPILLVDESDDSTKAIDLLKRSGIEYVKNDIRKFDESCCGELPTTKAPSVFAVEGVFKGLEKINEYMSLTRDRSDSKSESESAYW